MDTHLKQSLALVTTAHLADACLVVGVDVRCGPSSLGLVAGDERFVGPAQPVRHTGSVDIILEGIDAMPAGAVLVIDDDGRVDRACIGDLTALEAKLAGAVAMVVNGLHRDTAELTEIAMSVMSLGASPTGPLEWSASPEDALAQCRLGTCEVRLGDTVVGDGDGIVILPASHIIEIVAAAELIRDREHAQAKRALGGVSLREQFDFDGYLDRRRVDPSWTFRQHLVERSASIEA